MSNEVCSTSLAGEPLSPDQAAELSRAFKALSDPVRLRLLSLIASHAGGEACVCDLTGAFELTGPTISHHLKVLREAGLVAGERRATWIYYRVDRDVLRRLSTVLRPMPAESGAPPQRTTSEAAVQDTTDQGAPA
ncbi:ArsR/SmtB family transcription factor [Prauserella rugosa]|uniref:ArsR family transcriptional regulator n=1 Tax=Prauserella rugosa TaxID=43354 RepID=A0A660CCE7_9PSEU|nr:metalloregulator ArsR/SmtB family transcription factor [Prauserella rugosa]KID31609.1 putative transcriptional regulator [Prauserella sp. Am3]TWH19423.1 ArsR family transcriptional regulator [Prauserella rugosa]